MTYREHYNRTQALRYTTYIRKGGKGFRLLNGELITESEFQRRYKLPVRCFISQHNPCNKHKYLDV